MYRGRLDCSPAIKWDPPHFSQLRMLLLRRSQLFVRIRTFWSPLRANRISSEFMSRSLFEEGASALTRWALKGGREAPVNVDVAHQARRTALVAFLAIFWTMYPEKKAGACSIAVVFPVAEAGSYLSSISRPYRHTIFELRRADLKFRKGAMAPGEGASK